jgi:WD40 repeat protein
MRGARLLGIGAAIAILLLAAGNSGQVGLSQGQLVRTLTGHSESVNSVAFSPDGRLLASGSSDWTIKLWDVATGREVRTLTGHTSSVASVAFSPDGRLLASGSYKEIKLWDVATGQEVRTLTGHTDSVTSVAFSPDGRLLASGSDDNTIKLWDVATGQEVRTLTGHTDWVWSVAFSPDGRLLASGSLDGTIKLWDVASGREVRTLGYQMGVWSMAFSPDGRLLASGSCGRWDRGCVQGEIRLWDVATGSLVRTLVLSSDSRYNSYWVTSVAFSPNGRLLASGSCIQWGASGLSCIVGDIRLWEVASGREVPTLWQSSHVDVVWSVAFSPDGRLLASGSQDHSIKLWDISDLLGR